MTEPLTLAREFEIRNKYGIHARPAALFVKTAAKFLSDIMVEKGDVKVSGKSIMGLLTIEGHEGAILKITVTGTDAEEALSAIGKLFETNFAEE